jgi:hypothetical protein
MAVINLKYASVCADCGSGLPAGTRAKYYGRGRIYGFECHRKDGSRTDKWTEPEPRERRPTRATFYGEHGPTTVVNCGCEDYPCCGCA